ncbi:GNAT family N-acetyltransferase [Comamonas piscis]
MTSLPAAPSPSPQPGPSLELRIVQSMAAFDAPAWDGLLALQQRPTPFMRHAYLQALEDSGSATLASGWQPCHLSLWQDDALVGACPMYLKSHSYGEYVFDFAWARAYAEHGLDYFPKAVIAVPFTPVPGSRLLVADDKLRAPLLQAATQFCEQQEISSLHLLFGSGADLQAAEDIALLQRENVQFHWRNRDSTPMGDTKPYADFDDFLNDLQQEKRKKIRQERRKVQAAGVTFRHATGAQISDADWAFFYQCYERTYLEHGNAPYLTPAFFESMRTEMAENWLLFIAEREGQPIAASLIAIDAEGTAPRHAYGRYWGAIERVDCLHFEACYYQPIEWCIRHGLQCFEGGAQGEHKMARALMPLRTPSAHWLAHAGFAQAVERYLDRESQGMAEYQRALQNHSPLKSAT